MIEDFSLFNNFSALLEKIFNKFGISPNMAEKLDSWAYIILLVILATLLSWGLNIIFRIISPRLFKKRENRMVKLLIKHGILSKIAYCFPPVFILPLLPFAYSDYPRLINGVERVCWIYLIISISLFTNYLLRTTWQIMKESNKNNNISIHSLFQLAKGIVITLALIGVVSIIIDKSPANLITGLGAFAAILMLIFKDTILGLVASIQLMQNDIIRKGDWVMADNEKVNGIISDITLNTVKIINFDNSIVTTPPYSLISSTLKNWRAMQESGGRRIMIALTIETSSITATTTEQLHRWSNIELIRHYIKIKEQDRVEEKVCNTNNPRGTVNGTIDTNLGVFRAYTQLYINSHPLIKRDMLNMVRLLEPTDNGIPFQIYCFTSLTEWKSYESVRSEITEHIISSSQIFDIRLYQNASGYHYISSAYIGIGKNMGQ